LDSHYDYTRNCDYIITWDQALSIEDDKKMVIKYFDKAGTEPEIKIVKMWKLYAANLNKKTESKEIHCIRLFEHFMM
jgi:predicted nucleic acid-binding protein